MMSTLARRAARWFGSKPNWHAVVLLYHRVAELESDPWGLAVSRRLFAEHLRVLRDHTDVLSLRDTIALAREGALPRHPVALTFDDGYRNNLQNAKLLLEQYDVPATTFVLTGAQATGRVFWWDELNALLLQSGFLPREIRLTMGDQVHHWELAEVSSYGRSQLERHSGWRAWETPPGVRQEVYRAVWELLHPLDEEEREEAMVQLRASTGKQPSLRSTHGVLSVDELTELAGGGLIDIGAHTVTHPSLVALSPTRQQWDIWQGREQLEQVIEQPVTTFAYPFGRPHDYTRTTVDILRESGFTCACTNFAGVMRGTTDPYQIPRIYVTDMDGEHLARLLSMWLPLRGVGRAGAW